MVKVAVVIVTHNSSQVIESCLVALDKQTTPIHSLVIVDSGSTELFSQEFLTGSFPTEVVSKTNIGFSRANNCGVRHLVLECDYILFLNPDAFLHPLFVERSLETMDQSPDIGILTGKMVGFDMDLGKPTGRLDSTGIFRAWYGRWYDRGQGEADVGNYTKIETVPAVCGALMFCRKTALDQISLPGGEIFDPDFFLYKEDIELSLRMKKAGWTLQYHPELKAYHCRGWKTDRRKMPLEVRRMASKNELLLYLKHPSPYILWALFKYILVIVGRV